MDTNKLNRHVINIRIYFPSEKKNKIYVKIYNTCSRTLYSIFLIKIEIVYIVHIECQSIRNVGVPVPV